MIGSPAIAGAAGSSRAVAVAARRRTRMEAHQCRRWEPRSTRYWTNVVGRSPAGRVTPGAARVSPRRSIARVNARHAPSRAPRAASRAPRAAGGVDHAVGGALHVTNGDAPVREIAAAARIGPAEVLPWLDVLHDGPVPAGLTHAELARVRAAHLASRGWAPEDEALRALLERDERLAAHPPDAEIVLWFEDDLFDTLQLAQVADRLAGRPGTVTFVALPHDHSGLDAAFPARGAFTPTSDAFAALSGPDPRAWADHGRMARLREELPDSRTGLSRLEAEILDALADGPLDPHDLFLAVAAREQPPWLGDT